MSDERPFLDLRLYEGLLDADRLCGRGNRIDCLRLNASHA